jgi:voltage-gated sodium channel
MARAGTAVPRHGSFSARESESGDGGVAVSLREKVHDLVESRRFQHTIMAVILVNAVTLGAETSPALVARSGGLISYADRVAVAIFVVELCLKFYAYRLRFFRDPWNCFDLVVVSISLVPATGAFAVLRALRALRLLRLISVVPSMRRVVATLLAAMPGVSSIVGLLALMLYVSAVMATKLFGEASPQHFGDLGRSLWTLFQVMTTEGWTAVANDVMAAQPMAWIFFLIFILVSTFVVLNLFLAVVVNAMDTVRAREAADAGEKAGAGVAGSADEPNVAAELAALRGEIAALRRELGTRGYPHGPRVPGERRPG